MTTDGVLGTRTFFLVALLLFLSGCATTQQLGDEDRRKIRAVRISSTVQKAPEMFYLGPGTSALFAFGAIGGAAAYSSSVAPAKALQDFAEKNGIFIEKIAYQEIDAAFRQSGKVKVSEPGEPTDAVVNVIVYLYGFGVRHGFSSSLLPVVGIRCEITDATGKVLASAYDYVHAVGNPVASMTLEEMRNDPKRIDDAWRVSAKRIAANIAKELGFNGSSSLQARAANTPPTASAAADYAAIAATASNRGTTANDQSALGWIEIREPEELRAIYSNTTIKGEVFRPDSTRGTPIVGHFRSDGTGILIMGDQRLPRTWEVRGNDLVCVTDARATNCYRYARSESNRSEILGRHVSSGVTVRFTVEEETKPR